MILKIVVMRLIYHISYITVKSYILFHLLQPLNLLDYTAIAFWGQVGTSAPSVRLCYTVSMPEREQCKRATIAAETMYNLWEMEAREEERCLDARMRRLKDLSARGEDGKRGWGRH